MDRTLIPIAALVAPRNALGAVWGFWRRGPADSERTPRSSGRPGWERAAAGNRGGPARESSDAGDSQAGAPTQAILRLVPGEALRLGVGAGAVTAAQRCEAAARCAAGVHPHLSCARGRPGRRRGPAPWSGSTMSESMPQPSVTGSVGSLFRLRRPRTGPQLTVRHWQGGR